MKTEASELQQIREAIERTVAQWVAGHTRFPWATLTIVNGGRLRRAEQRPRRSRREATAIVRQSTGRAAVG